MSMSVWSIDQSHSSIHFKVRHMMISWVRGGFATFHGTLNYDPADVAQSSVDVEIDAASINTREGDRDTHLKSADFLDVAKYPVLRFQSKSVTHSQGKLVRVTGDLTIHGVSHEVAFDVEGPSRPAVDPWGNSRMAASASLAVSRKDFGLTWNSVLEAGGLLVGDEVTIDVDVEFIKSK
jgi:polyisoprenoid-binding protein YceI